MKEENSRSKEISNIISSNGNNKKAWENLLKNIISNDSNINNDIISDIYQFLIKKSNIEINLDILDFIIQYGSSTIIELFVNKNLSKQILELLKNNSKSSVNIQKKIIFLIQKWARKYEKEKEQIYSDFINNYKSLQNAGIMFPPNNFKMVTYEKYISNEEAQNIKNKIKIDNENNFANPFLSEKKEINNKEEKKNFTNESFLKKNLDNDNEENPYNQDNKINNNNIKNNNNFDNNYNNLNSKEHQGNNYNGLNEQKSHYPKFPSQFNNDIMNNLGKNSNNIRQNNNNKANNSNNNSKNQFPNYNNSYNNKNNNMNINFNKINNNNNNNRNNNSHNNFNRNINYNNNINNNNCNNQYNNNNNFNNNNAINYNCANSNYNNRNVNNNKNYNFSSQNNNNLMDFISYKKTLGNRLLQLNSWINEGKYSYNFCKLKEGILEIINEIPKCENKMNKCRIYNDKKGYEIMRNMKMDMEQTCSRYEELVNDREVEPFNSSFFGNSRQYYFNKRQMFGNKQNSIPNDFNDYYNNNNYENSNQNSYGVSYNRKNYDEREVSVEDKLMEYGGKVKDGLCFVGGKIKDTAISGFNFVKDKINEDDDLSDI